MAALLLFGIGATDAPAGHYTMEDCGRAYAVPMTAALVEAGRLAGLGIDPTPQLEIADAYLSAFGQCVSYLDY